MPYKIKISRENEIKSILEKEGYQFVDHNHAFWRAKKGKVNMIFYTSGTFQIQGEPDEKIKEIILNPSHMDELLTHPLEYPIIGLDESGKGDYFGPLVLAGVLVDKEQERILRNAGVDDSKRLSKYRIFQLAEKIKSIVEYQVIMIEPQIYNQLYNKYENLNRLMINQYINLLKCFDASKYQMVILDKFSQSLEQNELIKREFDVPIIIEEKAEKYISVAAASILARNAFNNWMDDVSEKYSTLIMKGSGPEARNLFAKFRLELNPEEFASIAKTHFKVRD